MNKQAIIFEVSDRSFEKYVIGNSDKVPVFVVFMDIGSEPCHLMSEMMSSLATEFAEQFIFAKVDIDENPELKQKYEIKNIPTLKVFVDSKVVASEEGALSDEEGRALLKNYNIFNPAEEKRLQARQHHIQGETPQAIMLLTQLIQEDPSNTLVAMDMVQIFIDIGEVAHANDLFNKLPETVRSGKTGSSLKGQLWIIDEAAKTDGLENLKQTLQDNPDNFQARFDCAICEIAQHDYPQALDHLFYIQQNNAEFKDGAAREMIVTIIDTIAQNDSQMAQQYRSKLAGMLAA